MSKRFANVWTTSLVVFFLASCLALVCCDGEAGETPIRSETASESIGRAVGGFDEGELAGDRATLTIKGTEFAFRYCPAGEFLMGSPEREEGRDEEETQHKVVLTKGYWLMETELTQAQWEAITGENPSGFKGENLPVETVS
ncbi:MAG: SUMF1/EgtB/PvdO family nonheme iron enzyme [Thermoguttaceae bacterium]|nr:SUMF1/EgtB/PvdO family nonheme iron enzyme [Thermoguttaceae bacterium]